MKAFFNKLMQSVQNEIQTVDMEDCDISIQEAFKMIEFLRKCLGELRVFFLAKETLTVEEEITFFKEMKPQILSLLIYFNKIHSIEIRRPNGSNEIQQSYYIKEQDSLTHFFERNIDFYQYYRTNAVHLDEYYFVRGKGCSNLSFDSLQFIKDSSFSTGYDFKVAKILANEMLRIYLNKRLTNLDRDSQKSTIETASIKWTASKTSAIELGYAIYASGVLNNGNIDIRDIMAFIENSLNIDLGDFYRTYITIKNRKKDRTAFLNSLIENLIKRMNQEDAEGLS